MTPVIPAKAGIQTRGATSAISTVRLRNEMVAPP
jgi:hypothetical protein